MGRGAKNDSWALGNSGVQLKELGASHYLLLFTGPGESIPALTANENRLV